MTGDVQEPALGVLELATIARGVVVADALIKRAEVRILASRPVSSGKFLLFLRGGVAEMEEAMDAGRARAVEALVDSLLLPLAHEQLWPVLPEPVIAADWGEDAELSAGVVETSTVCAALAAADAACKAAHVTLRDVRLAVGIAGKAFFTMTGDLNDVEAAIEAATDAAAARLVATEILPAPAGEIVGRLIV